MKKCTISNRVECLAEALAQSLMCARQQKKRPLIAVPNEALYSYVIRALAALLPEGGVLGLEVLSIEQSLLRFVPLVSPLQVSAACLETQVPLSKQNILVHALHTQTIDCMHAADPHAEPIKEIYARFRAVEDSASVYNAMGCDCLCLFGFASLSPRYMQVLSRLALQMPIEGFFVSPCMMYWHDLINDKAVNTFIEKYIAAHVHPVDAERYREVLLDRNPLLANCGNLGKQFFQRLDAWQIETKYAVSQHVQRHYDVESFCEQLDVVCLADGATHLEHVQGSLLLLEGDKSVPCRQGDTSIQVHGAPTRFREVEVLYEQLTQMTWSEPLTPGAICIAVEHLSDYLPALERVFKAPTSCFSYTVLGEAHTSSPEQQALEAIVQLPAHRFSKEAFFRIVSLPVIQENFAINAEDWARVGIQFKALPFSFGLDTAHSASVLQKEHFSPSHHQQGTWTEALEAIRSLYISGAMSGNESECLKNVVAVISQLFADLCPVVEQQTTLVVWLQWLYRVVDTYVKSKAEGYFRLIEACERLRESTSLQTQFSFDQFIQLIQQACTADTTEFMRHVTQEIVVVEWPSIGVPCQVLALLGLEERPQVAWQAESNRYRIIEAVLAARRCLYLSYTNYSYEDNAPLVPAMQVQELLRLFDAPQSLHVQHPLISKTAVCVQQSNTLPALQLPQKECPPSCYVSLDDMRSTHQKPLAAYCRTTLGLELSALYVWSREKHSFGWFDPEDNEPSYAPTILPQAMCLAKEAYKQERIHRDKLPSIPCQVELSISCHQPYEAKAGYWVLPAIHCGSRVLYGMLHESTDVGLVVHYTYSKEAVYALLPDLLVRSVLNSRGDCDLPNIIYFTKDGKSVRVSVSNPMKSLEHCMDLFDRCHGQPLPLYPESIQALAQGKLLSEVSDPYFAYARIEEVRPEWVETAKMLIESVEVTHV